MGKQSSNNYSNNININFNRKSNAYGSFKPRERKFKYCWKCGASFPEPLSEPFCNDNEGWCKSEYHAELAADIDDIVGIN